MNQIKWPVEPSALPKRFAVIVKDNPELSRQVQEYFFKHICAVWWGNQVAMVKHTDAELLYFTLSQNKHVYEITYGCIDTYNELSADDKVPQVFVNLGITSIEIEGTTTVIDGKQYDLKAVQDALKRAGVKPV